jgi:hypothetical protein
MAQKTAPRSKIDREADEILAGMGHTTDWISPEKLEELSRDVEGWETIVQRQRDTVNNLRTRYSAAICQQKEPQDRYVEIQRRMANYVKGLAQANQDEVYFFDEHHAVGAIPYYRPMRVNAVGLASDPNSVAAFHHREEGEQFAGIPFDADDPPVYESQASYLDRHKLLTPAERRRLRAQDFKPVKVSL